MDTPTDSQSPEPATEPQHAPRPLTFGEKRVRFDFNPSRFPEVDLVKKQTADIIDFLNACKNDEVSKTYGETDAAKKELSGEKLRSIALAQTAYEEACMWAVKALTA